MERTRWSCARGLALVPALIAVVTGVLVLLVLLWKPTPPPRLSQHVTLYPEPKPLPEFRLIDEQGQDATRDAFGGRWSLVFFGYTHCPDVCPTTLGQMQQLLRTWRNVPEAGEPPRMVFVTVDPQRDTPQRLATYLDHFGAGFLGLTGEKEEIDRLARAAGAFYRLHEPGESASGYLVDHSASITLVDPRARIVAIFPPPIDTQRMLADLREIIRYREEIE